MSQRVSINDFHIHSHESHPFNEYVDSICTHIAKKPQESRVRMTPISPVLAFDAYCIDVATALQCPGISEALQAPDDWNPCSQIGLDPAIIAAHIDSHGDNSKDITQCVYEGIQVMHYYIQNFLDRVVRKFMSSKLNKSGPAVLSE